MVLFYRPFSDENESWLKLAQRDSADSQSDNDDDDLVSIVYANCLTNAIQ